MTKRYIGIKWIASDLEWEAREYFYVIFYAFVLQMIEILIIIVYYKIT